MKVICINNHDFEGDEYQWTESDPHIGEECIVEESVIGYGRMGSVAKCYRLKGYTQWVYDQRNFAVVSDIDETELIKERETVNA